jgi:hypothetical protein
MTVVTHNFELALLQIKWTRCYSNLQILRLSYRDSLIRIGIYPEFMQIKLSFNTENQNWFGGMIPCVKPRHRLGHNIKRDMKYTECENVNWIHVA